MLGRTRYLGIPMLNPIQPVPGVSHVHDLLDDAMVGPLTSRVGIAAGFLILSIVALVTAVQHRQCTTPDQVAQFSLAGISQTFDFVPAQGIEHAGGIETR